MVTRRYGARNAAQRLKAARGVKVLFPGKGAHRRCLLTWRVSFVDIVERRFSTVLQKRYCTIFVRWKPVRDYYLHINLWKSRTPPCSHHARSRLFCRLAPRQGSPITPARDDPETNGARVTAKSLCPRLRRAEALPKLVARPATGGVRRNLSPGLMSIFDRRFNVLSVTLHHHVAMRNGATVPGAANPRCSSICRRSSTALPPRRSGAAPDCCRKLRANARRSEDRQRRKPIVAGVTDRSPSQRRDRAKAAFATPLSVLTDERRIVAQQMVNCSGAIACFKVRPPVSGRFECPRPPRRCSENYTDRGVRRSDCRQ